MNDARNASGPARGPRGAITSADDLRGCALDRPDLAGAARADRRARARPGGAVGHHLPARVPAALGGPAACDHVPAQSARSARGGDHRREGRRRQGAAEGSGGPDRRPHGRRLASAGAGAGGGAEPARRLGAGVPPRGTAGGGLHFQARIGAGRRLQHPPARGAEAVARAHRRGSRGAFSRDGGHAARAAAGCTAFTGCLLALSGWTKPDALPKPDANCFSPGSANKGCKAGKRRSYRHLLEWLDGQAWYQEFALGQVQHAVLGPRADGAGARAPAPQPAGARRRSNSAPATSTSIAKRAGCDAARATSISDRRISACSNSCWRSRAGCSPAPSCSTPCGVRPQRSTSEPWMCMSGVYGRRCRRGASAIRSAPFAARATPSTRPSANQRETHDAWLWRHGVHWLS